MSSQEYDKENTVQYKNSKAKLPKITPQAMIEVCEVRDECHHDTSPVVMEDCVNKNLYEIHIDVTENETETNQDAMKMVTEECLDDQDAK